MDFFVESSKLKRFEKQNTSHVTFAPNISSCIDVDVYSALWISICVFGVEGLGFRVWGSGFGVRVFGSNWFRV